MKKPLPKKVETEIVISFLDEFGQGMKKEFNEKFGELKGQIDKRFGELKEMVSTSGSLIGNTHREVKHFVELHEALDKRLAKVEGEISELRELEKRVTALEEKLVH